MAVFVPPRPDIYPFGKKMWQVKTDVCGFNPGDLVHLTLSVCGDNQFTCDDGSCIILDKKCDLRVDCLDQSDEEGCTLLKIQPGYSVTIPPPPVSRNKPLEVNISVVIISFPVIKTQDLVFETNFKISLAWQDIRLNFLDLKNERSLNLLPKADVTKVWTPIVFFRNANGNIFTNLDQGSRVECIKNGSAVAGGQELAHEGEGRNNTQWIVQQVQCKVVELHLSPGRNTIEKVLQFNPSLPSSFWSFNDEDTQQNQPKL